MCLRYHASLKIIEFKRLDQGVFKRLDQGILSFAFSLEKIRKLIKLRL